MNHFIIINGDPNGVMELINYMGLDTSYSYRYNKTQTHGIDLSLFIFPIQSKEKWIEISKKGIENIKFFFGVNRWEIINDETITNKVYDNTFAIYANDSEHKEILKTYLTKIKERNG